MTEGIAKIIGNVFFGFGDPLPKWVSRYMARNGLTRHFKVEKRGCKNTLRMKIKMNSEWHERLAAFKKYYGYTNADLAKMSGNTLQSVKNISQGEVPGWLKFAIQVWEKKHNIIDNELKPEEGQEVLIRCLFKLGGEYSFIWRKACFEDGQFNYTRSAGFTGVSSGWMPCPSARLLTRKEVAEVKAFFRSKKPSK